MIYSKSRKVIKEQALVDFMAELNFIENSIPRKLGPQKKPFEKGNKQEG